MYIQVLATEQHRHIGRLLARHGQLVHHLELHIFRHVLFPEGGTVYAGSFAFKDLYIVGADDLAVDVGQHPAQFWIGMLQHGIDSPHSIATALAVMPGEDGFEDVAPVRRTLLILRIDLGQGGIASGFFQPQFQLGLIRVEADSGGCIRAAYAAFTYRQPIFTRQLFGANQA